MKTLILSRLEKFRKNFVRGTQRKALEGCPQKKGICILVTKKKPKKPNSAKRTIAKVSLSNGRTITVFIPGIGCNAQKFTTVLIRGGKTQDLPGLNYKAIRGVGGLDPCYGMRKGRSKYACPLTR